MFLQLVMVSLFFCRYESSCATFDVLPPGVSKRYFFKINVVISTWCGMLFMALLGMALLVMVSDSFVFF